MYPGKIKRMIRRRAVLVNYLTNEPVDPNYQPLLSAEELSEGNENLEKSMLRWRLRWLNNVISITGDISLTETSTSAQLQQLAPINC
jgi:hypothetical protein